MLRRRNKVRKWPIKTLLTIQESDTLHLDIGAIKVHMIIMSELINDLLHNNKTVCIHLSSTQ